MRTKNVFVYLLVSVCLSSCASMFSSKKHYTFDSYPQGAQVLVGNKYVGLTPCFYDSKRKVKSVTFISPDGERCSESESLKFNGLTMLNWFNAWLPGFLVDGICGVVRENRYTNFFYDFVQHHGTQEHNRYVRERELEAMRLEAQRVQEERERAKQAEIERARMIAIEEAKSKECATPTHVLDRLECTKQMREFSAEQIYKKFNSAVFMILTSDGQSLSQGSGFFVSKDGIAISNYHVFEGTGKGLESIRTSNHKVYKVAEVLGYSKAYDYIVFRVDGSDFNYIPITKRGFSVGEKVYAIGSPKTLANTFSDGVISADRRDEKPFCIQISVPIDHGSSGGALINKYGEVVGITSAGLDDSGANLNFACDIRAIFAPVLDGIY